MARAFSIKIASWQGQARHGEVWFADDCHGRLRFGEFSRGKARQGKFNLTEGKVKELTGMDKIEVESELTHWKEKTVYCLRWAKTTRVLFEKKPINEMAYSFITGKLIDFDLGTEIRLCLEVKGVQFWCTVDEVYRSSVDAFESMLKAQKLYFSEKCEEIGGSKVVKKIEEFCRALS